MLIIGEWYSRSEISRITNASHVTISKNRHCAFLLSVRFKETSIFAVLDRLSVYDLDENILDSLAGLNALFPSPEEFSLQKCTIVAPTFANYGKQIRGFTRGIVCDRVQRASYKTLKNAGVRVLISFGDRPILDTTFALATASETGLGMSIRFDCSTGMLHYTLISVNPNMYPANVIMNRFCDGEGFPTTAWGSSTHHFLKQFFNHRLLSLFIH